MKMAKKGKINMVGKTKAGKVEDGGTSKMAERMINGGEKMKNSGMAKMG